MSKPAPFVIDASGNKCPFWKMCEVCGKPYYAGLAWQHMDCEATLPIANYTPVQRMRYEWEKMRARATKRIFVRDGEVCKQCGATNDLTIDHVTPIAKGGTNNDGNLQVLCHTCNGKKGDRL